MAQKSLPKMKKAVIIDANGNRAAFEHDPLEKEWCCYDVTGDDPDKLLLGTFEPLADMRQYCREKRARMVRE
jgi:hypothetical protein